MFSDILGWGNILKFKLLFYLLSFYSDVKNIWKMIDQESQLYVLLIYSAYFHCQCFYIFLAVQVRKSYHVNQGMEVGKSVWEMFALVWL